MEDRFTDISNVINRILRAQSRKTIADIKPTNNLQRDFGFDSIDLAEFSIRIEAKFGVDIFSDGILNTISEIVDKIDGIKKSHWISHIGF